ncbi:MAG TPA: hypothetical protein VJ850_02065, partial [Candidatus Limnocylindrales bacterium]|nr:hypothetical protein [Candidatus Limnocylindrales bacterium]
ASWEFGIGLPPRPVTETVEFTTIDGEHVLVEDILEYLHAEDDEEFLADHPDATEDEIVQHLAEVSGIGLKVTRIALADIHVRPSWDEVTERVDVAFWHPEFSALRAAEAETLGVPAIEMLLGDEMLDRWVGSVKLEAGLRDGRRLGELPDWIETQTSKATGDRWVTEWRLDQRRRRVALRFNAARKTLDDPVDRAGLLVVIHRDVVDPGLPEGREVPDALRELSTAFAPGADLVVEVSEARRLSRIWFSTDALADRRAAIAWGKRHRGFDVDVDIDGGAPWIARMGLADLWRQGGSKGAAPAAAPVVKVLPDGRLYRQARWIERHPRRVLLTPLLLAIGSIAMGVLVPSMARDAAVQLIGAAGLVGLGIATYMSASTYVTFREHPKLGCLAVLFDGWRIVVITVVSLVLVSIYLTGFAPT